MRIVLEKADANGYKISDSEYEILQNLGINNVITSSAELGGLEVHNPQNFPGLYLSSEDYDRIYKNVVGDVLDSI